MNAGRLEIDLEANTKNFDYQIEQTEAKLNDLLATYEQLSQEEGFNEQSNEARSYREEIEKSSNSLKQLRKQQAKVNNEGKKGWNLNLKSAKKLALGIIGVRSAYSVVQKASNAYLSQDTELAQKLQSVWVGLGSYLAPILEKISDLTLKALGYFNEFIKALTGTDYIARANAKALDKQAKAQNKLNKATQQYDFDVIRTQSNVSNEDNAATNPLVNIPNLDQNLVAKLQNLATWLRENETAVKAFGIALGAALGAAAIAKIVGNIKTLIGAAGKGAAAGAGLAGLAGLLLFVADVFVITLVAKGITDVISQYKELNELIKNNTELTKDTTNGAEELSDEFWKQYEAGKLTNEQIESYANYLQRAKEKAAEQIIELENQKTVIGELTGKNDELTKQQQELAKQFEVSTEDLKKMGEKSVIANKELETLEQTLSRLTKDPHEVEIMLYYTEGKLPSWSNNKGVKAYATGGIVTQPTRALIGEAGYPEAVVPMTADYLSTLAKEIGKYSGGGNCGTTNVYLDGKLIQREMSKVANQKQFATNGW